MTAAHRDVVRHTTDAELIGNVATGNLQALGELFERYEPAMRRYFCRMGVSASDADDLIQNTFLEVARAATRFDPACAARAWILGVSTIMVRRHRRSLHRAAARIAQWTGLTRDATARSPEDAHEGASQVRRLAAALDAMSPKKREAFVLVTLEGLSGEDAAQALGVPVNTIWTRLHHARRELRAAMKEGDP